ncbi:MAG TPA: GrpB family protein [Usitatibacter sp.]|nr:GrpB family protein [Usitatibacter sp.]
MSVIEPVVLSPYSPLWPAVFDFEKQRLLEIMGADDAVVEHVGSTAVPGMGAKPIIDVMVGVADLAMIERRIPALVEDGYRYVPEFERAIPERRYFVKARGQPGHFHLHGVVFAGPFWKRLLAFRDALRADAALAAEYWKLKQRLAARFPNDREAYTEGKTTFIREVEARAGLRRGP